MSKNSGIVRAISYHQEFLEVWGLEKPVPRDEGTVVVEVSFHGSEVLQDIQAGDIIQIEKKG